MLWQMTFHNLKELWACQYIEYGYRIRSLSELVNTISLLRYTTLLSTLRH